VDEQDRAWVEQRAFNVIGHELRTPVTTVRGLAEVLAANPDSAERADLTDSLLRNARRLEALVDELLAVSGVMTALPAGPAEPVDLGESMTRAWPDDKGLVVAQSGLALARRQSVDRILAAIAENAVAYGERPVTLAARRAGTVTVLVIDSPGAELPGEDVKFALEPFWRGERAVTRRPGLGLGLTIAEVLAHHEGGRLWVEAREGGGMVTYLELPAA
jgi:two-component system, OmpR family, phosphate regulon sensor histidine kinase PhoR